LRPWSYYKKFSKKAISWRNKKNLKSTFPLTHFFLYQVYVLIFKLLGETEVRETCW